MVSAAAVVGAMPDCMSTPTASAAVTALPQQLLHRRPLIIGAGRFITITQPPASPG